MSRHLDLWLSTGPYIMALPLGDEGPVPSGGTARWSNVPRPRRRDFTDYEGTSPWSYKIKVFFDQWPNGDVEHLIRILEDRMTRHESRAEPDLLRLTGPAMPRSDLIWALTEIDYSGQTLRRPDGRRCRQELVLTFLEYVAVDLVVVATPSPAAAAQERQAAPATPGVAGRTYTVKRGDTLSGIAAKEMGSATKWQQLADANNQRDPRNLRVGQVLRIP